MSVERALRPVVLHPDKPIKQQRVPQAEFTAERNDTRSARRNRKLLTGPLPNLHERLGETLEFPPRRRKRRPVAVTHEQAAAKLLLERSDAGADRGLGDMKTVGRLEKAAGMDDLKEGPRPIYVQRCLRLA